MFDCLIVQSNGEVRPLRNKQSTNTSIILCSFHEIIHSTSKKSRWTIWITTRYYLLITGVEFYFVTNQLNITESSIAVFFDIILSDLQGMVLRLWRMMLVFVSILICVCVCVCVCVCALCILSAFASTSSLTGLVFLLEAHRSFPQLFGRLQHRQFVFRVRQGSNCCSCVMFQRDVTGCAYNIIINFRLTKSFRSDYLSWNVCTSKGLHLWRLSSVVEDLFILY